MITFHTNGTRIVHRGRHPPGAAHHARTIDLSGIEVNWKGGRIADINTNHGDSATPRNVTVVGDSSKKIVPCQRYTGNDDGDEPDSNGSGADGTYCTYSSSDITCR